MAEDRTERLFRGRPVERLIFGTADADEIAAVVASFCRTHLGAAVARVLFTRTSVGVVFGLELADGRRVVLKAHQPRERPEFLRAVFEVQTSLAGAGFPCPCPLAAPAVISNGIASVEELVEAGEFADPHRPEIRLAIARALAHLLELTRPLGRPAELQSAWSLFDADAIWPATAHSPIFDFEATRSGAEWIDEFARKARAMIQDDGEPLIVHTDWSGKHFRFDANGRITVVYDWDSLALRTELKALGIAAATFTSTFELDIAYAPTPEELRNFINDYSGARTMPLTTKETRTAHAIAGYLMAYTARCEHALGRTGDFAEALRAGGRSYLP